MNKRLLNLYSLKFNPFSSQLPATALWVPPPIQSFCWRLEHQIGVPTSRDALAVGDPGVGKSAALRILSEHLKGLRDLCVGTLTRPQAKMADFYRELGHLFGVVLSPNNRWHSSKTLREKWLAHIEAAVYRPVLIIDEAQEMNSLVLSELRLLASADLDSRSILTIILAGDARLAARFEEPDLLPIASRIRSRLRLEALPPKALQECLNHLLKAAGNPKLLAPSLILTLCEQAVGILGGEPQCCKSFLALDVAVSVASGAACLCQFPVRRTGSVLLFPAEDSLAVVRQRLAGIAAAAQVPFDSLPVQVIIAPPLPRTISRSHSPNRTAPWP
jgi:type II secretory pathway predicted ATPase ExeA